MCGEENRDKGEIKKTKGEANVAEKKKVKKRKKRCCVGYTCGVGLGHVLIFFFLFLFLFLFLSKLMKKKNLY